MDYSPYDIDFVAEGRRRVHAFSYVLTTRVPRLCHSLRLPSGGMPPTPAPTKGKK